MSRNAKMHMKAAKGTASFARRLERELVSTTEWLHCSV